MKFAAAVFLAVILGACSVAPEPQENEAVHDYVAATELEPIDKFRIYEQVRYRYINDYFVVVRTRRNDYLLEFRGRCTELRRPNWTPDMIDIRVNPRFLHAKFDTIRGCVIGKIYEVPEANLMELAALGDAPGDEVYLPEEEAKAETDKKK